MVKQVRLPSNVLLALALILTGSGISGCNPPFAMGERRVNSVGLRFVNGVAMLDARPYTGIAFTLFANGNDTSDIRGYKDGLEHGVWRSYYENGQLSQQRVYDSGQKISEFLAWWENGNKKLNYHFVNNEYEGTCREWGPGGQLIKEMNYSKGYEQGPQKMYYDNGKIKANYTIIDGRRYGLLGTKNCSNVTDSVFKVSRLPYYNTPDFTPIFVSSADDIRKVDHRIPAFSLTDQDGKNVTEQSVTGKIHVANFMFTSCGSICPVMTTNMKQIAQSFLQVPGVMLISYSVTPWIDDAAKLKKYTRAHQINTDNWRFLTGSKGTIYNLARRGYFAEEDLGYTRDSTEFLHTEHFLLVDKTRRIRGIYNGTLALEAAQLIRDIRLLLKE